MIIYEVANTNKTRTIRLRNVKKRAMILILYKDSVLLDPMSDMPNYSARFSWQGTHPWKGEINATDYLCRP